MAERIHFLEIDKPETHRVAWYRWGDPAASKTVICAHGLSRNSRDFDFLAEALAARGFQVIAADMPGRGQSSHFKDGSYYNNLVYIQDIKFLLDRLGLSNVAWLGTSMGGIMAMLMETYYPKTITSLILNDIGCILPLSGITPIAAYLSSPRPTDEDGLKKWLVANWVDFDVPGTADDPYWQHLFRNYLQKSDGGAWHLAYDANIVTAFTQAIETAGGDVDFSTYCQSLASVPTLLIRGEKSTLLTQEIAQKTRSLWNPQTPFEEYLRPNAGHAPILMHDEEILRVCNWFMKTA